MSKVCKRCGQSLQDNGLVTYVNKHTGRTTKKRDSYCKACKK
nr:MAG TPA: restriction endonuclease [Caudoviricetes sp.]